MMFVIDVCSFQDYPVQFFVTRRPPHPLAPDLHPNPSCRHVKPEMSADTQLDCCLFKQQLRPPPRLSSTIHTPVAPFEMATSLPFDDTNLIQAEIDDLEQVSHSSLLLLSFIDWFFFLDLCSWYPCYQYRSSIQYQPKHQLPLQLLPQLQLLRHNPQRPT